MLVAFARHSRDQAFTVLRGNAAFIVAMTAGAVTGTLLGALLPGLVPNLVLPPPSLYWPRSRRTGQWGLRSGGYWRLGELAHQARDLHHAPVADELAVGNPEHLG
jgi:hypothetical protein